MSAPLSEPVKLAQAPAARDRSRKMETDESSHDSYTRSNLDGNSSCSKATKQSLSASTQSQNQSAWNGFECMAIDFFYVTQVLAITQLRPILVPRSKPARPEKDLVSTLLASNIYICIGITVMVVFTAALSTSSSCLEIAEHFPFQGVPYHEVSSMPRTFYE
jgi:hypothetical protein